MLKKEYEIELNGRECTLMPSIYCVVGYKKIDEKDYYSIKVARQEDDIWIPVELFDEINLSEKKK